MDQYNLDSQVRWLGMFLDKKVAGELYRHVPTAGGLCAAGPL
jgi:sucrose synthase